MNDEKLTMAIVKMVRKLLWFYLNRESNLGENPMYRSACQNPGAQMYTQTKKNRLTGRARVDILHKTFMVSHRVLL